MAVPETYHLLHVFPSFGIGGMETRTTTIINNLDRRFRHTVISLNGEFAAAERLAANAPVELMTDLKTAGDSVPRSMVKAWQTLKSTRPDMLLTYNWAALDWALTNAISAHRRHIHHEGGFNVDEAERQLPRRVAYRRLALLRSDLLIVPAHSLYEIARAVWKRPEAKIRLIPNGIDWRNFISCTTASPEPAPARTTVLATLAPLRPEKNIAALLRIAAELRIHHSLELVIIGDGPDRSPLENLAAELGLADICRFEGMRHDIAAALKPVDIFLMPSLTEQMPNSLLQAMAAAKSVVAYDVGDISRMVCPDNAAYIVTRNDEAALLHGAEALIANPDLRRRIGDGNLTRVKDQYSESDMIERYTAAYCDVLAIDR